MPLQVWMLQLKVIQKANKCTVLSELVKDKVKSTVPAPYLSNTLYAALGIELKSILEIEKNQWWTSKWKKAFQNSERSKKQDLYSLGNRSKADLLQSKRIWMNRMRNYCIPNLMWTPKEGSRRMEHEHKFRNLLSYRNWGKIYLHRLKEQEGKKNVLWTAVRVAYANSFKIG